MSSEAVSGLAAKLGGTVTTHVKSVEINVPSDKVPDACTAVAAMPGFYHLSTITGMDLGEQIEIIYHFWQGKGFLDVRTSVPKADPRLKSISKSLPSAVLYEAEIQDLLGVAFDGNPYLGKKLLLPDKYPADAPPPLRKEADPDKIRKALELE